MLSEAAKMNDRDIAIISIGIAIAGGYLALSETWLMAPLMLVVLWLFWRVVGTGG